MSASAAKADIVVSGISGQYPMSDNIEKFKENLFSGIDMVTADAARWPLGFHRLPHRNGKVYGLDKFDNRFFGISDEDVAFIDPQDRMLMEEVYLAICDAGVDPESLRGSNTGYFHGACYVETNREFENAETMPSGKTKTLVTRIPLWLGLRGPILDVDTACGSGLSAFAEAYHSIKNGICDQAIATASNTLFRPRISIQFRDLKMITKDGKCKCLDASADGYVRSEAVVALFLQRSRDAKRIYCHLLSCRSNSDGFKEEGITFPSVRGQTQLLRDTYADAGIDPADIDYIEAHITGTRAGDPVETNAMHEVICKSRKDPVLIGCLKSNVGHTEGSSGLCAISKAIIVYQMRRIPPNLHYHTPNLQLNGLNDGSMIPVTRITPFTGTYIPVNCFGFGGANTHLITADPAYRDPSVSRSLDPRLTDEQTGLSFRLILVSGRIPEAVDHVFSCLRHKPMYLNREFLSLLNDFSKNGRKGFPAKGFMILQQTNGQQKIVSQVNGKSEVTDLDPKVRLEFLPADADSASLFDASRSLPVFSNVAQVLDRVKRSHCTSRSSEIAAKSIALQISCLELLDKVNVRFDDVIDNSTGRLMSAYIRKELAIEQAITSAFQHDRQLDASSLQPAPANGLTLKIGSSSMMQVVGQEASATGSDPGLLLTQGLGQLFLSGVRMDIEHMYPAVSYPLPSATPFLAPVIQWDHRVPTDIKNFLYDPLAALAYQTTKNIVYRFDQSKSEDSFFFDHKIDGRFLFPATGYLMIAWSAFAKLNKEVPSEFPIRFEEVRFHRATVMSTEQETTLSVRINEDLGLFEIKESDFTIVSGKISAVDHSTTTASLLTCCHDKSCGQSDLTLSGADVYKELRIRGYDYGPFYQAVRSASSDGSKGDLIFRDIVTKQVKDSLNLETSEDWSNLFLRSWGAFTDSMFQLQLLQCKSDSRFLFVPTLIQSLTVIPEEMKRAAAAAPKFFDPMINDESSLLTVYQDNECNIVHTDGVILKGFQGSLLQRKKQPAKLLEYKFLPFDMDSCTDSKADADLIDNYHSCLTKGRNQEFFDLEDERFALLKRFVKTRTASASSSSSSSSCNTTKGGSESDHDSGNFSAEASNEEDTITLSKDLLLSQSFALSQQTFFKSLIDIVIYNLISTTTTSTSVDVLEVSPSSTDDEDLMVTRVKECLDHHLLHEQYTTRVQLMTGSPVDQMDESVRKEYTDVIPITDSFYDTKSDLKSVIPSCNLLLVNLTSKDENTGYESLMHHSVSSLRHDGFLLLLFKTPFDADVGKLLDDGEDRGINNVPRLMTCLKDLPDMRQVAHRRLHEKLPFHTILMTKKKKNDKQVQQHMIPVGTSDFDQWLDRVKDLVNEEQESRVWLTADPRDPLTSHQVTGVLGMVKSMRCEFYGPKVRCLLDFDAKSEIRAEDYPDILSKDLVQNVRCNGVWGSYEHILLPEDASQEERSFELSSHFYLRSLKPGDLKSLSWVRNSVPFNPDQAADHVRVYASALNFKDVLFATGRLPMSAVPTGVSPAACQDSLLGLEYAGIDRNGRRVMGLLPFKALASTIPMNESFSRDFLWPIPDSWSFEDAATVPVVYSTVIYALIVRGNLTRGETVLIHAGAGGVGLAAISICLYYDCHVITTCGSEEKRDFLIKYSGGRIDRQDILHSRDTRFEEQVLRLTNGQGVDVILNSLSDEKFESTMRLLSPNGRFLEIGKVDMINDRPLDLTTSLSGNQTMHGIFLDMLTQYSDSDYFSLSAQRDKRSVIHLMTRGIEEGFVKPLPRVTFSKDQVEEAFRFMGSGKHVGKIVIRIRDTDESESPSTRVLKTTFLSPKKSFLVIGGLGGLGLELVQWLVTRGARNIVINSRRGISNNYQKFIVQRLKSEGVTVLVSQSDSTTRSGIQELIDTTAKLGPVGGVFNSAVVYQDCLLAEQTVQMFEQAASVKSNATIFLDDVSRSCCPELEYFVTFSSISAGRGNEGQTNYNFGNSVMDSVCMRRVSCGLPGLSVQWGVIGDVGLVADMHNTNDEDGVKTNSEVILLGSASQRVHSVFETLDRILGYGRSTSGVIASIVKPSESQSLGKEGSADLIKLISNIIGLKDLSRMDDNTSLGSLGIDSLIAVEIKQSIERVTGVSFALKEVRDMTIARLSELGNNQSSPDSK